MQRKQSGGACGLRTRCTKLLRVVVLDVGITSAFSSWCTFTSGPPSAALKIRPKLVHTLSVTALFEVSALGAVTAADFLAGGASL